MGKRTPPELIARLLTDTETESAGGKTVAQVVQKLGVGEQVYQRDRQRWCGVQAYEALR
jgi:hypothetical protein